MLTNGTAGQQTNEIPPLREELEGPFRIMLDAAKRIGQVSEESKVAINTEEYVSSFKPALMEVVYAWCSVRSSGG